MENLEKLKIAFSSSLGINIENIDDNLAYGFIGWDSVAHMKLIAAIEDAFDIMLDTDDVIDMSSFSKAKELIGKYDIIF
ncbi:MAG: acyl carrier protein [Ignavibacteria bacterium]|nr:acyl carrier protein [Ignavibacteria bacterium]